MNYTFSFTVIYNTVECRVATDERERESRNGDEAETRMRREQSRAEGKAEDRDDAEQKRGRGEKPAEFRAMNVGKRELELAGEARFFIGSAQ